MLGKIAHLFRRKDQLLLPADMSILKTDVHSHFIPGIDDGSDSIETSLELLRGMADLGYMKVITTPHVMSDYYRNTSDIIKEGCDKVREALVKEGLDIEIECAAEYYLDGDFVNKVKKRELLTFGDDYVLFELPFLNEPPNMHQVIFEMQLAGYKPVLAHPERYSFWHLDFGKYESLIEKSVLLQLNINSLTGHYSPQVKKIAQRLTEENLISLLGSDCHHIGHIHLMQHAVKLPSLHRLLQSGTLLNSKL